MPLKKSTETLLGLEEAVRSVLLHRSIIAIDIERSTSPLRTNPIREELRHEAYRMLATAMRTAGIADGHCDPLVDRGRDPRTSPFPGSSPSMPRPPRWCRRAIR